MNRKQFSLLVLGVATALLALLILTRSPRRVSQASITMLDIGQGDSFLIESPEGARLLIDGGPANAGVLSELAKRIPWSDRTIDVVIATHPDADHIAGLASVLDHYNVGLFLTSEATSDTQTYTALLQTVAARRIPAYYARHGMHLVFDETMHFDTLFPDRDTSGWETNTASVVGKLSVATASALFTGDAPSSIEDYLVDRIPRTLDADILKIGHHGSKYSSSEKFLKAVSPALALISVGAGNRYGHPSPEVLDRLAALGIPFVATEDHGQVRLATDGISWTREDER